MKQRLTLSSGERVIVKLLNDRQAQKLLRKTVPLTEQLQQLGDDPQERLQGGMVFDQLIAALLPYVDFSIDFERLHQLRDDLGGEPLDAPRQSYFNAYVLGYDLGGDIRLLLDALFHAARSARTN